MCVEKRGLYGEDAGRVARGNQCTGNQEGIVVRGQAGPTLEANLCLDNTQVGLGYTEGAGGTARQNECAGSPAGIVVAESANPEVVGNHCHDNDADVVDQRPPHFPGSSGSHKE